MQLGRCGVPQPCGTRLGCEGVYLFTNRQGRQGRQGKEMEVMSAELSK